MSRKISYILTKPLRGKGNIGDVVSLAKGFGRYLEKYGMAQRATDELIANIEINKKAWEKLEQVNAKIALELLEKIKKIEKITIIKKVSQGQKLYEAVKKDEIIAYFQKENIELKTDHIKINVPIKTIGHHEIVINVYGNYETVMNIEIVQEEH